ncbi:HAD family hydrolase [Spirulina subsalsa FACHB-351]|uniref:HAD family hydrolase n=1 Tax=Spirulina subsalsa FACHB-351 TaxID=234711 RepID=A0ABT3L525_9CYAN|nr:HAD family hydrolase [Spirulina subsalsa]MCW6036585.1 HAD family hydrolase [Spirulina subsalsa FACHB-351]
MSKPKVILFDAVGTLFGVKGSVGEVYSAIAQEFGVQVEPKLLDQAFHDTFKKTVPLAFPGAKWVEIPEKEYNWWQAIAKATFAQAGVLEDFQDFPAFFNRLYGYFATPDPWEIYPDILPSLEKWRYERIELGIISNFDSRIHSVLDGLDLKKFFQSITISSSCGVAKPNPKIFTKALEKHQCSPSQAWFIGDSLENDYRGAKAAGLRPFLLQR